MKQYSAIDLFKLFAAILVVAIHTHPFYPTVLDYYFTCFCRIAVPFFFVATSFFFFRKPDADIRKYNTRMLTIYILWFVIELPIVYHKFFIEFDRSLPLQMANFARCLLFSNTWGASWYIMACVISVNIIYYLTRTHNNMVALALAGCCYFVSLLGGSYYGAFVGLLDERSATLFQAFCYLFCPTNSFIVALMYIVAGKVIAANEHRLCDYSIRHRGILLIATLSAMLSGAVEMSMMAWSVQVDDTFVFLLPLICVLFVLLMGSPLGINKEAARWCRSLSILIYLIHPIFTFINSYSGIMDEFGLATFVVVLATSMLLASLIIILSKRYTFLRKLY